jgi:hypothetical protein
MNVRTTSIGYKKRDAWKKPIRSVECEQVEFMNAFAAWFQEWDKSGEKKEKISRETFLCAIQTSTVVPSLARYLLDKEELSFLLLGKFNSDPIERRFGHYRQLAGANYFLSVRQFLEAEKTIRIRALVKYSKLTMREIADFGQSENAREQVVTEQVEKILSLIEDVPLELDLADDGGENVVYFVSGYIAKCLLNKVKCQLCVQLICESGAMPPLQFIDDAENADVAVQSRTRFLDQVNRGGLVKPSDLIFLYCLHAHELHKLIFGTEEIKNKFISSQFPRVVFAEVLKKKLECSDTTRNLVNVQCSQSHDFSKYLTRVANTFCNCMLKNFVSEVNDKLHEAKKRISAEDIESANGRKVRKLQAKK